MTVDGGRKTGDEGRQVAVDQEPASPPLPAADYRLPSRGAWQREIELPAGVSPEGAKPAAETVRVPAGEYQAMRVAERLPGGETATVWLAPGVGIVRRAWAQTGLVEELESFSRPAPDQDRKEGAKGRG